MTWHFGIRFAILLSVAGCGRASEPDVGAKSVLIEAHRISKETLACRDTIGTKPGYHELSRRMSLVELFNAILAQMSNAAMASSDASHSLRVRFGSRGHRKGPAGLRWPRGHSLMVGFITSAAESGAVLLRIADQSRHKSLDVLRGYVRRADMFKDHTGATFL